MRVIRNSLTMATITLLAGCGGGGGGGSSGSPGYGSGIGGPDTIYLYGSLGAFRNADIEITDPLTNAVIGSGNVGNNGQANIANLPDVPKVITIKGVSGSSYFDPASCGSMSFKTGESFHAMVPNVVGAETITVNVSMFSELAYQWAVANGGVTEPNIALANEKVRVALTPELLAQNPLHGSSQIATMTGPSGKPDPAKPCMRGNLASTTQPVGSAEGQNVAAWLYFAAYPMLGSNVSQNSGRPLMDITHELSLDIRDGVIDGQSAGGSVNPHYSTNATTFKNTVKTNVTNLNPPGTPSGWNWTVNPILTTLP